jgi:hypothetical protein
VHPLQQQARHRRRRSLRRRSRIPQHAGGTSEVKKSRCNREKGSRHDHRGGERFEVVAVSGGRRAERWRDPADLVMATRLASVLEVEPE